MSFLNQQPKNSNATPIRWSLGLIAFTLLFGCTSPAPTPICPTLETSLPILGESEHFSIRALPPGVDAARILSEIETTMTAVANWLGPLEKSNRIHLFANLPQATGEEKNSGHFFPKENILTLTGDPKDERFWDILRHEAAHAALRQCGINSPPFWLDEGIATLFEAGTDLEKIQNNPRRRPLALYLLNRRGGLHLSSILTQSQPRSKNGVAYTKAWSVLLVLYLHHTDETAQAIRTTPNLIPFPAERIGLPPKKAGIRALEKEIHQTLQSPRDDSI